jgi:hypothetical protein
MGIIQASDVKDLLRDKELMSEIAGAVVEDPNMLEALADEIAEEIDEEMENAPELRKQIIDAAMALSEFRKKLASKLVEDDD